MIYKLTLHAIPINPLETGSPYGHLFMIHWLLRFLQAKALELLENLEEVFFCTTTLILMISTCSSFELYTAVFISELTT